MDRRLRELERRFNASGSPEDEVSYLRARLRSGNLERSRLRLAVYCRHEPAIQAFGENIEFPSDLRTWVKTVAVEFDSWRVVAWLLHAGLHEAFKVWSITRLMERDGPRMVVDRVVSILRISGDRGHKEFLRFVESETTLIEQHAAREQMWDGAGQEGFVVHLAFRAIEIMTLDRWRHTGEIVDHCAQAIHRLGRMSEQDELATVRVRLKEAIEKYLIARAFNAPGPLRGYSPVPVLTPRLITRDGFRSVEQIKKEPA